MAPTGVTVAPIIRGIAFDRRQFSSSSSGISAHNHNVSSHLLSSALLGSAIAPDFAPSRKIKSSTESQPIAADHHHAATTCCSLNCRNPDGASTSDCYHGWIGSSRFRAAAQASKRIIFKVRAERDPSSSSGGDEVSVHAAVDEGKRLLALQKELLEQVTERKKLLTSLTQDFGTPKLDQTTSLQEPKIPGTGAWPPQTNKPLGPPPQASSRSTSPPSTLPSPIPTVNPDAQRRLRPPDLGSKASELRPLAETTQRKVVELPPAFQKKQDKVLEKSPPVAGGNVMNVIIVASECAPWSKTGGLGDVAGALPKALARRGHRVMAVAPRYKNYAEAWETGVRKVYDVAGQDTEVGYFHAYIDGVDFVFVDSPMFHAWAHDIYGGSREDVLARMVLLCKAAVEIPWHVPCGGVCYGDGNLVFIANDWHTALLPVYLQAYYRDNQLMQYTRSVLVIHNIAHQGRGPLTDFGKLGLPEHFKDKFALYDPIGGEHMNIFMAGILTAHRVIAVSHGYAWECQTQEGGWGLDNVIRDNSWKLKGVVNGIDDDEWNPELDPCLRGDGYTNYNVGSLETGKASCKAALQKELGLPVRADVPLLGFIGRLDYQKGVDIIAEALPWMMGQDLQLVMLGTGRPDLEDMLRTFEANHRDKVRGWVGFSVKTAHRITAGVDILLMPSRFEPCGLNQLYAMRYGTIPVVHAVGGLRDTVKPFDPFSEQGLGWTFDRAESSCMIHAIGNAMWTFRDYKASWKGIQLRGMNQDLSWDHAAQQYEEVLVAAKYQW